MQGYYTDDYKRVWGQKSINGDITIVTDQNDKLNIETDVSSYEIQLKPKTYKTEYTTNYSELIREIKERLASQSHPIEVSLGGFHKDQKYNVVVLRMTNDKDIKNISGSFFDSYFKS